MRSSVRFLIKSLIQDIQAASDACGTVSALPYSQRIAFVRYLREEILNKKNFILDSNKKDCDKFAHHQQLLNFSNPSGLSRLSQPLHNFTYSALKPKLFAIPRSELGAEQKTDAARETGSSYSVSGECSSPRGNCTPIRIDKLMSSFEWLLHQPDPIALPKECWLQELSTSLNQEKLSSTVNSNKSESLSCADDLDRGAFQNPSALPSAPRIQKDIDISEITVPLGFIAVLSRYRPRMLPDAVSMAILSGNCILLDGGPSILQTNRALMECVRRALIRSHIPTSSVVNVSSYDDDEVMTNAWLRQGNKIDLCLVCGSRRLYDFTAERTKIPLIKSVGRPCTIFVDASASFRVALNVVLNAKFQRAASANSVNTLLVHEAFPQFDKLLRSLKEEGAILLGDNTSAERVPECISRLATDDEYSGLPDIYNDLDRALCVKSVEGISQVIYFLELYGSGQADGIVATDEKVIKKFCRRVDAPVVLVNSSTRLSSGPCLGLGSDLAVSTSKVHRRGPFTLSMMTTKKIVVRSTNPEGSIRI